MKSTLWLVAPITCILLSLTILIVARYELEDDVIDKIKINIEIGERYSK